MLIQTYRENAPQAPFIAFCPRCKDRCRFESGANETVCNCTVKAWGFATNAIRLTPITGRATGHKCNAKCLSSKGGVCNCSCGGKNHGSAWA